MATSPETTPRPALVAGDAVTITARDATASDTKSGLYYPYFGNLRGVILKIYGEEASILIDRDSLPAEIRTRHEANETAERKKYLDRISEAARGTLSSKEKNFPLQYTLLVGVKDLTKTVGVIEGSDGVKRLSSADLDSAEAVALAERAKKK